MIKRIHIMGIPGTGKSTIAKKLASKINCNTYDLDDLLWERKYDLRWDRTPEGKIKLIKMLNNIVKKNKWVVEGCSRKWIKASLDRADLIIFLDLPIKTISLRLIKRYIRRKYIQKQKHKENLLMQLELIKCSKKLKNETEQDEHSFKSIVKKYNKKTVHLKTQKEVNNFIENFK